MSFSTQLLMLPSDTPCYTPIDKSGAFFHPNGIIPSHKLSTPTPARENSPLINSQLSNVSRESSSLQSGGQFEFDDLPTWTLLSDGSSVVTSPTDASDGELQVNDDVDSDVDEAVPRKRQKTRTGSNARSTISNVLVKSRVKKSTTVDGGSKEHKLPSLQNFATPTISTVDSEDTRLTRVAISNAEPNPTTSISSCVQINPSPTTVIRTTPALSQNAPVKAGKESNSTPTRSQKRANGLSGLLVSRPASTSDSSNSGALKDHEEPPRKTRGLALRSTNWSYGTKSRKSQGRIADQDELELWTNADVAHIGFKKPDELNLLNKVEEESTRRNVSHILTCLMEMEAESFSENVADGFESQEDEETRDDVNSPQVALPQLEDWSTTLHSLLKGKKKFQHQDLIDLKNALIEIYNKRANISATSSLAQEVYKVTQLEEHDVPNRDELRLRALARKSTRYWGIGRHVSVETDSGQKMRLR